MNKVKSEEEVKRKGSGEIGYFYAGLFVCLLLVGIWPESARAQLACRITQITDSTGGILPPPLPPPNFPPSISSDGTRMAFPFNRDLTGGNPNGNREIFLFDTTTGALSQITNSGGSSTFDPLITADGTRVVFSSLLNLTGDNPDGGAEVFVFDTATSTFTQITNLTGGPGAFVRSISADAARIVFESENDVDGGNPDRNVEIFLLDTTTGKLAQITNSTGGGGTSSPAISGDGTRIVFSSRLNLTGDNPDGSGELFLFDVATSKLTQITNSLSGSEGLPSINFDGTRIAFQGDGIFLFDTTTGAFTQIINSGFQPAISGDGTRIALSSLLDLTGDNPDGNIEIFLFDIAANTFTQVTKSPPTGGNSFPSIDSDGTRIAFQSTHDLTGGNPDRNTEIFLADCLSSVNNLVSFEPRSSTFRSTSDTSGCPSGFVGKFSFDAGLINTTASALSALAVEISSLTNGNLLQNAEGGPGGVGARLSIPTAGGFSDGVLEPNESADVPFVICLKTENRFNFFVNVLGIVNQ